MTLVAGVFPRTSEASAPEPLVDHIVHQLSRNSAHQPQVFRAHGAMLAKVDIDAYGTRGDYEDAQGARSLLCGEPLLSASDADESGRDRSADLQVLHDRLLQNDLRSLSRCDGVFSLAHLSADSSQLLLATDHLGVRPIYYAVTPELIVFSSVLRLFEDLPGLSRTVDARGMIEYASLGYCLGNRTPFSQVRRLGPASVLTASREGGVAFQKYFSWEDDIVVHANDADMSEEKVYRLFVRAVKRRLRSDKSAVAFLSGGLDSRSIVSVLRELGVQVHSYSFPVPGEQDDVFANRFAEVAGTDHHVIPRHEPMSLREGSWSFLLSDVLARSAVTRTLARPRIAWSGDGGSVGVGAVYIDDKVDAHLRRMELMQAIKTNAPSIPLRVTARAQRHLVRPITELVFEEVEKILVADPVRRFHLFLMFNDQHRHLDRHFEQIDMHGLEFHLPFFDASFVKEVLRVPIQRLRNHRFYHDWLKQFPAFARSVPWQTYPGHLPCPVPSGPTSAAPQWEDRDSRALRKIMDEGRRIRLKRAVEMLLSPSFPGSLLSRTGLLAATLAHATRLREYDYVLDFAHDVYRFARNATGVQTWVTP